MRYRIMSREVRAIRYDGANEAEVLAFHPAVCREEGKNRPPAMEVFISKQLRMFVLPGEWLLEEEDGTLLKSTDAYFRQHFEEIPDE